MAGGQERGRQPEEHTSCPGSALLDMNQLPESSKQENNPSHTAARLCHLQDHYRGNRKQEAVNPAI